MPPILLTAIVFLIILSLLVFVHEFGHYIVARIIGVKVEEFGFGLPPRIVGKKVGGTMYSLNWLPIGGFVRLAGEDDGEEHAGFTQKTAKQFFWARSKKERSFILSAGVTMNFILAVAITTYLVAAVGLTVPDKKVTIKDIQKDSPAQAVKLQSNDIVAAITYETLDKKTETKPLATATELKSITSSHLGENVTLTILRNGEEKQVVVMTRKTVGPGQGAIGITISDTKIVKYAWQEAPVVAVKINIERVKDMLVAIGTLIGRLVTLKPLGADVAGPIGIAQVTGQAVKFGLDAVLEFMSILSLNLAVLNVLPIPALDGGRLLFVFAEKILGRKVKPAFERSTHQIGMIILFILILLVSIHDILRLARGG